MNKETETRHLQAGQGAALWWGPGNTAPLGPAHTSSAVAPPLSASTLPSITNLPCPLAFCRNHPAVLLMVSLTSPCSLQTIQGGTPTPFTSAPWQLRAWHPVGDPTVEMGGGSDPVEEQTVNILGSHQHGWSLSVSKFTGQDELLLAHLPDTGISTRETTPPGSWSFKKEHANSCKK